MLVCLSPESVCVIAYLAASCVNLLFVCSSRHTGWCTASVCAVTLPTGAALPAVAALSPVLRFPWSLRSLLGALCITIGHAQDVCEPVYLYKSYAASAIACIYSRLCVCSDNSNVLPCSHVYIFVRASVLQLECLAAWLHECCLQ